MAIQMGGEVFGVENPVARAGGVLDLQEIWAEGGGGDKNLAIRWEPGWLINSTLHLKYTCFSWLSCSSSTL